MTKISRRYADTSFGQVHVRCHYPIGEYNRPPVVVLHPAPYSGLFYKTAQPFLAQNRHICAPDYPGYGGSDPQENPLSIADYATAIIETIGFLSFNQKVDLLGFHTGCLVAAEIAHSAAPWVNRIVMCDIPYFTSEQQTALREKMTQPLPLAAELECLQKAWDFSVAKRVDDVPLPRALEMFTEHLRAGTNDWYAFDAAFSYDCEARFSTLDADVTCLATQSGLHEPTKAAAEVIPGATFVDVPEITSAVFEAGAENIAKRIHAALDSA